MACDGRGRLIEVVCLSVCQLCAQTQEVAVVRAASDSSPKNYNGGFHAQPLASSARLKRLILEF